MLHTTSMQTSHTSSILWWKRSVTQLTELPSQRKRRKPESRSRLPVSLLAPVSFPHRLICASQAVLGCPQGRTTVKKSTPEPRRRVGARSRTRP